MRTEFEPSSKTPSKSPDVRGERRVSHVRRAAALATACATFGAALVVPGSARADEVSPKGKGIVGGALLGAEVVTVPMALFNVRSGAAYAIGGGLGAVGGGVAGFAIERSSISHSGRLPAYLLAGGIILVIPTAILILNATRERPSVEATEDQAPTNGPVADPGKVGGSVVIGGSGNPTTGATQPSTSPPAQGGGTTPPPATGGGGGGGGTPEAPQSLLDFHHRAGWRMGVPVPDVKELYTTAEQRALGLPRGGYELRMPVVRGTF